MNINNDIKLDYDDVLICPKMTQLNSRSEVNLDVEFDFDNLTKGVPVCIANMGTTGTFEMAKELSKYKIFTALHKHYPLQKMMDFIIKEHNNHVLDYTWITMGTSSKDYNKIVELYRTCNNAYNCKEAIAMFPKLLMIDIANGYQESFISFIKNIRKELSTINSKLDDVIICCGNVVTSDMAVELVEAGANIIKVGLGSGAVCTTRLQSGVGYPQLSAIMECSEDIHNFGGLLMADGGIRTPGDAVKAFAAGADFVMAGSYFAGSDECEGKWEEDKNGEKYLIHYGMASKHAMEKYYVDLVDYRASEGKVVKVKAKGKVIELIKEFLGGIRSACTYTNTVNLKNISNNVNFIKVNRQINNLYD